MKKILSIAVLSSMAFALEFQPLGFRAVGMGGAGVASASSSNAVYYNPALLANHKYSSEFSLEAGLGLREVNLANPLDKIVNDDELGDSLDKVINHAPVDGSNTADGTNKKIEDAINQIKKLSNGNGLSVMPTAGFGAQIGNFGIGVYANGEIAASAIIDKQHLKLIVKDNDKSQYYYYNPKYDTYQISDKNEYDNYSLKYALDNNLTYINLKGIVVSELPIGYAFSFDFKGTNISIGGALKAMQGITYTNKLSLTDTDSGSLNDSLTENKKTSSTYGIDLGVLVKYNWVSVGLVGKDLNSPKFDFYNDKKYKIKPLVRGGAAINLSDWLTFAMDIDLTNNSTFIPNYSSKYIGGGFDIHQSWASFRLGAMKNMKESAEGTILTGGIGLGLKWFQLDLAVQASTKKGEYDGNQIPKYVKANLSILSRWGG